MLAVPAFTPVTTPVPETTVATDVALLFQVPVPLASAKSVVVPLQKLVVPVIAAGKG